MYLCVCMYVSMCMYVCMYVYVCRCVCMYVEVNVVGGRWGSDYVGLEMLTTLVL